MYAHREDTENHRAFREWLESVVNGVEVYGVADLVLSGFIRVVTHPRIFNVPSPLGAALAFARDLREQPHCVPVTTGPRHWQIFVDLCAAAGAKGNIVPDAYLAALAIESGSEWITTDRGFARFRGLRWRHPLD